MGLYDDRLADLSEARRRRVTHRYPPSRHRAPVVDRSRFGFSAARSAPVAAPRKRRKSSSKKPTKVQSLLFSRSAGWTASKAKAWAKSNGYKYGKVDVTDQYIRIRQFDPKGSKTKRTITFGRGIRAVVAREVREESMAKGTKVSARRRRRKSTGAPKRRRRRRVARAATAVAAPRRRRRRRRVHQQAAAAPRRRRRSSTVMQAPRRRRRRRRAHAREAWRGDRDGHRKAAKKGWRRKKASSHRRRRRRVHATVMEAPRRRRRRRRTHAYATEARRSHRRRRHYSRASRGGGGMGAMDLALGAFSGGAMFILADGLDRFLATYNPAKPEVPKDKFTSTGAGTLANTLNVASTPSLVRVGASVGLAAVPTLAALYVRSPMARAAANGAAIGAWASVLKTLWSSVVVPMLLAPKDTSPGSLQKSFFARLYPAEIAAHINMQQKQQAVSSSGSGALSAPPSDVGPFALGGDSAYPDAAQALRRDAGMSDQFPTYQNTMGTGGPGSDYPTAAQAMGTGAPAGHGNPGQPGLSDTWAPGPPPGPGPGPQKPGSSAECGCIGGDQYYGLAGAPEETDQFFHTG